VDTWIRRITGILALFTIAYCLLLMIRLHRSLDRTDREYKSTMDTIKGMLPGDEAT
jgi:hypothetical protein